MNFAPCYKREIQFSKMKKFALLVVLLTTGLLVGFAQDEEKEPLPDGWYKGGGGSAGASFTSLSNWSAGGENTQTYNVGGNLFANLKSGKHAWDNSLNLQFGLTKLGSNSDFRKSGDLFDFTSLYGYEVANHWFLSSIFNFRTQFANGWTYDLDEMAFDMGRQLESKLFAPAYINFGAGMQWKPKDNFSLYMSPSHLKLTIVADDVLKNRIIDTVNNIAMYGVTTGESSVIEVGALARMHYHVDLADNVFFTTDLNLFYDYLTVPVEGAPIDVDLQAGLTTTVLKYININIFGHLIYDADIYITNEAGLSERANTQIKGVLGIGLGYSWNNETKLRAN
jgi:hypothetical protein